MYYPGSDSDSKSGDDPKDTDYTPSGEYGLRHFKGCTMTRGVYKLNVFGSRESARPWKRHSAPRPASEDRFLGLGFRLRGLVGIHGLRGLVVEQKARA